jgi:hypothetical protein
MNDERNSDVNTSMDELTTLQLLPPVTDCEVAQTQAELDALADEAAQADKAMNIRMSPDLHELCLAAAGRDGLKKSVWAREILTAVLKSRLSLAEVVTAVNQQAQRPAPQVFTRGTNDSPLGRTVLTPASCLHPRHFISTFETFERCLCGKNLPLPPDAGE